MTGDVDLGLGLPGDPRSQEDSSRCVVYESMTGARFREIADDLRERIALGEGGGSGAMDSEAALGQRYGASRMTVRKALELLRDQGLVDSRQGPGWFVSGAAFHQRLALGTFRHAASAVSESGRELQRGPC